MKTPESKPPPSPLLVLIYTPRAACSPYIETLAPRTLNKYLNLDERPATTTSTTTTSIVQNDQLNGASASSTHSKHEYFAVFQRENTVW